MRRRPAAWILLIIAALVLYFFSNETVTLALLLALIAAVPVSLLMLRLTYKNLLVSLEGPAVSGGKQVFTLQLRNSGLLPLVIGSIEVRCANLRTGETDHYEIRRSLGPRGKAKAELTVTPGHAGVYELSVSSARISDPLGIRTKTVSCGSVKHLTSAPDIFEMHIPSASSAAMPESDTSSYRKGAVAGDMIGIREYVPGDPVRNIHWKLSEKTDKMLVKELGEPATDNFLILQGGAAEIAHDPAALDAAASVLASLMHTLRENDILFSAAWMDPQTGEAALSRINSDEDLSSAADNYLAVPASMPVDFRKFERQTGDNRFAHIIIVGSGIPENIDKLTNGCEATMLMYGGSENLSQQNLTVLGFDASTYRTSLSVIDV